MSEFFISGIQQVGVGTQDMRKSWDWFIDMFGVDVKILEDDTVAERMLPYTGGVPQKRHACVTVSLQGGGGFEIWQYSNRKPKDCEFEISIADTGIFAAKVKCKDVVAFHKEASAKWDKCHEVVATPNGTKCFFMEDLYGNYFQVIEEKEVYIDNGRLTGGMFGAFIGVTDIEKSLKCYRDVLGYDTVIYDETGVFEDWKALPGSEQKYRRVLLGHSQKRPGAFGEFFGTSTIELVQPLERTPRKIYEGRYWGDPGFIQVCYDVTNMKDFEKFCESKGFPFTADSCPGDIEFDMGDASGHFTYIEDPDGTLIEFVETHKIPIVKKLGWFMDFRKRNRRKPLPKIIFRLIGLVSTEKPSGR
ncbi:MAG: VOC family protein [Bacteroidales bacterium]|nr:VOC family protein [Bacteroidales bacterium]